MKKLKEPVCLKATGHNVYEDANRVDPFGSYDLNTKDQADAADVDQLIDDHSVFPKAMAYNLPPEEKENNQSRGD